MIFLDFTERFTEVLSRKNVLYEELIQDQKKTSAVKLKTDLLVQIKGLNTQIQEELQDNGKSEHWKWLVTALQNGKAYYDSTA